MFKLLLPLLFLLWTLPAQAQNPTCPTRPSGDSTNACASTAFVNGGSGNILPVPAGGTGQGSFTANLPLIGNGTSALAQGTRSGSTTSFGTTSGALTNGDCVSINSGNLVDAGVTCNGGSGSGTITAGTTNQLAYYPSNGTTVAGTSDVIQTATGDWWQNSGGNIQRFNDRILVGGATVLDGNDPAVTLDWLSTFELSLDPGIVTGSYSISGLNQPNSSAGLITATQGGSWNGVLGGSQSLFATSAFTTAIGTAGWAVNNNTTLATLGWAFYGEAHRVNSTVSQTNGMELEVRNLGAEVTFDPYTVGGFGSTTGQELGCGAGVTPAGNPCTNALLIFANGAEWDSGIIFRTGAIHNLGAGPNAIQMPITYNIVWYSGAGVAADSITTDGSDNLIITTGGGLIVNGSGGLSCSGINAATFQSHFGIVTHC